MHMPKLFTTYMAPFFFSIDAVICLKGRNYPIWVREQGVGRNKSSEVAKKSKRFPSKSPLLANHHQIDQDQNENILHSLQLDRFSGDSDYGFVIWRRGGFPHHLLAPAFISFLQEILHWVDISMWEGNQDLFSHCFCSQLTMSWTSVWRTGTRYTGTTQFPSIFQSSQLLAH